MEETRESHFLRDSKALLKDVSRRTLDSKELKGVIDQSEILKEYEKICEQIGTPEPTPISDPTSVYEIIATGASDTNLYV